jgi:hypothetical protein
MLNDYTGFNAHVEGVQRIVALRGGVDNLGWDGFLKISVLGYVKTPRPRPISMSLLVFTARLCVI